MRHRIHARGGGQQRGQAERQFGVANGGFGHDEPRVKPHFAAIVQDQNSPSGNLAARAAGGGHGNDGGHPIGDLQRAALNGGVGFKRAFVADGNAHALGAVDGGTTAHGNQAIASVRLVNRCRSAHRRFSGVGGRLVKHRDVQVGQGVECFL